MKGWEQKRKRKWTPDARDRPRLTNPLHPPLLIPLLSPPFPHPSVPPCSLVHADVIDEFLVDRRVPEGFVLHERVVEVRSFLFEREEEGRFGLARARTEPEEWQFGSVVC